MTKQAHATGPQPTDRRRSRISRVTRIPNRDSCAKFSSLKEYPMADYEGLSNGDRSVEITDDQVSSKDSGLTQSLSKLENENGKILKENEGYKKQLEELKVAIEELRRDNQYLHCELQKLESDKKVLEAVADRAAGLETDVSSLQLDLGLAMNNLKESTVEIDGLGKELERVKESEKEKDAKLEAVGNEMDILSSKLVELKAIENSLKNEKQKKDIEILSLKKTTDELQGAVESSKSFEMMKADLEKTIDNLKGEISLLQSNLKEKEKLINRFELEQRTCDQKGLIGYLEQNRWIICGSAIAAVGVMGVACYIHAAKKI